MSAAGVFATALNSASSAITQQQTSDIQQGASFVTQANTLIDQISTLNGQIRGLTAAGDNPNTYLDQRDYAIDQLSQIVPTTTSLQPNGSALVSVDGQPVVSDTVGYHLAAPVIGTSSNGTPTLVVGFADDPNPSNPKPLALTSGELGAVTDMYNNKLVPYGQQLDNFASSAATEMNRITEAGVDLNSNAGTALFSGAAGSQAITAGSISVAITDPTQLPLGLISTSAGSLTQAMNSANNTVSTSAAIDGNQTLANPPAAGLTGHVGGERRRRHAELRVQHRNRRQCRHDRRFHDELQRRALWCDCDRSTPRARRSSSPAIRIISTPCIAGCKGRIRRRLALR